LGAHELGGGYRVAAADDALALVEDACDIGRVHLRLLNLVGQVGAARAVHHVRQLLRELLHLVRVGVRGRVRVRVRVRVSVQG